MHVGQGSGQQSVTGYPKGDDPNSLWFLKAAHGKYIKSGFVYLFFSTVIK